MDTSADIRLLYAPRGSDRTGIRDGYHLGRHDSDTDFWPEPPRKAGAAPRTENGPGRSPAVAPSKTSAAAGAPAKALPPPPDPNPVELTAYPLLPPGLKLLHGRPGSDCSGICASCHLGHYDPGVAVARGPRREAGTAPRTQGQSTGWASRALSNPTPHDVASGEVDDRPDSSITLSMPGRIIQQPPTPPFGWAGPGGRGGHPAHVMPDGPCDYVEAYATP